MLRSDAEEEHQRTGGLLERSAALQKRADALAGKVGRRPIATRPSQPARAPRGQPGVLDWPSLVEAARRRLAEKGVAIDGVDVSDLLDEERLRAVERRFRPDFGFCARLDRYDLAAAVVAGLVGALVDLLVVAVPARGRLLHAIRLPHDNALSHLVRASYDRVIRGMSGRTHRLHTLGHDPLVGIAIGTLDLLRGTMTYVDGAGWVRVARTSEPLQSPLVAFAIQLAHTLSDAFTAMGVPIPGWGLLRLLTSAPGDRGPAIADAAEKMYLDGYDLRHLLVMRSAPAAAEAVLRASRALRTGSDPAYAEEIARERGAQDSPRVLAMSLIAHLVVVAANAGKIAFAHGGSPLAIDIESWRAFAVAAVAYYERSMRSVTDTLIRQAWTNADDLLHGWSTLSAEDDDFPRVGAR